MITLMLCSHTLRFALAAAAVAVTVAGCGGPPSPVGVPDPGHRRMAALTPVLSVIPAGAQVESRQKTEPVWDSCDGVTKTYGWDPVTVWVQFRGGGTPAEIVSHIESAMRRLGWTLYAAHSGHGSWLWHHPVPGGGHGHLFAQLLGGPDAEPHDWSLQATAPPATHPVKGC